MGFIGRVPQVAANDRTKVTAPVIEDPRNLPGTNLNLTIRVWNVGPLPEDMDAWQVRLKLDPGILKITKLFPGPILHQIADDFGGSVFDTLLFNATEGTVAANELLNLSTPPDPQPVDAGWTGSTGDLLYVQVQVLAIGVSNITITQDQLNDIDGRVFTAIRILGCFNQDVCNGIFANLTPGPGDSVIRILCQGVLPATRTCTDSSLSTFETVVYDSNSNGAYNQGELIMVGPTPSNGARLVDDPKVMFRDTVPTGGGNNVWDESETVFYDTNGTLAGRVSLLGNPTASNTLIKHDSLIRIADSDNNGALEGIVRVTVRLENLGGTNIDGSQEDVDAIQAIYTYDPTILRPMRVSYGATPGPVLPDQGRFTSLVRNHCTANGVPLDAVSPDEINGRMQTSTLCTTTNVDVGLGCDPATRDPSLQGTCPGDPATSGATPLQNVDAVRVQFMILGRGNFTLVNFAGSPGNPGSKLTDIEGTTQTTVRATLQHGSFDNRAAADQPPVAKFTFTPANPITGQLVTFDGTNSTDIDGIITAYSWSFGDGNTATGAIVTYAFTQQGAYTVTLTVTDDAGLTGTTSQFLMVQPPTHDVGITVIDPEPKAAISGQSVVVVVTLMNLGQQAETVGITVYYDSHVAATLQGVYVPRSVFGYYIPVFWDTSGIPTGNYTISANVFLSTDQNPANDNLTDGQVTILPPPMITVTPYSGMLGDKVTVHGYGFPVSPYPGPFPSPVIIQVTFDDQFLGFTTTNNGTFDFVFNVPHAQVGPHEIRAYAQIYPFPLEAATNFTVLAEPTTGTLAIDVSVGMLYFPGDTVPVYVLTSLNGSPADAAVVHLTLLLPNGTAKSLSLQSVGPGLYKASYKVPASGSIGTYALVGAAQQNRMNASGLVSFEVKNSWISSNGPRVGIAAGAVGAVVLFGLAWRRGFLTRRRKNGEIPILG